MLAFHCFRNDPAYPLRRLNQMPVGEVGVNPHAVLSNFADSAFSMDTADNHENIIAKRRLLFEVLIRDGGPQIRAAARAAIRRIDEKQHREKQVHDDLSGEHDQRFE